MPKQRRKVKIRKKREQADPLRAANLAAEPPSMTVAGSQLSQRGEAAEAQSLELSTVWTEDVEIREELDAGPAGADLPEEALRAVTSAYDAAARAMEDADAAGREAEREVARAVREAERSCEADQQATEAGEETIAGE